MTWPRFWRFAPALSAALAAELPSADVVHIHSLYPYNVLAASRLCRRFGVPYVLRPHGSLDPYLQSRRRWRKNLAEKLYVAAAVKHAAVIQYTAEEERRLASPYVSDAPGVVVPLGIHPADYQALPPPEVFQERYPECAGRRIVLFLSRLNFKKGLDLLLPAFARALQRHSDLHLVLAGPDGGMLSQTGRWIHDLGLQARVTVTGMLLGDDKLAAFSAAEVFVLPSYSENFGISVVEAMACGLPVVISDRINIWREIAAANAGVVCACSIDGVARGLLSMLDDPATARATGENGRRLVRARYDWDSVGRELETLYRSVAQRQQRRRQAAS